ncbi:restriction endonuclease subunit S [Orbus sturtevantii]|uniref:restriction endonuclease subunit S n=1 Tax=Orbus sturtevantii TaxID=3074109 RepID=UPI00370D9132
MKNITNMSRYSAYKDSEYQWIGNLPEKWNVQKLGSCLFPVSEKNKPNLPLLSITRELGVIERDIADQDTNHNFIPDDLTNYKLLKKGQFGMNKMKAWQGSYGISNYTGIVSPAYFVFDLTKNIETEFFNWAIRSSLYVSYFGSASDGVRIGQWDLSKTRMKSIPFLIPPKNEQINIAHFLDQKTAQINQVIAIKQKQIERLKERQQIIIQQAVTKGLDPNVPMKDSGIEWIGMIPEHWDITKLKFVSTINNGQDYKQVESDNGFPVIGSGGQFAFANSYLYDGEAVLLGRKGTIDKPLYINGKFWTVDTMFFAICKKTILTKYLYYCAKTIPFLYYSTATALPSMTQKDLLNHKIVLPLLSEQRKIINFVDQQIAIINDGIQCYQKQIEKLKEYKTTLIDSAVTGKIKIAAEE